MNALRQDKKFLTQRFYVLAKIVFLLQMSKLFFLDPVDLLALEFPDPGVEKLDNRAEELIRFRNHCAS
jgi:hypothetical protein